MGPGLIYTFVVDQKAGFAFFQLLNTFERYANTVLFRVNFSRTKNVPKIFQKSLPLKGELERYEKDKLAR